MAMSVIEGEGTPTVVVKGKRDSGRMMIGGSMMFFGGLLMLTFIGAVIGIPLGIAGAWLALKRDKALQAACPYCAQQIIIRKDLVGAGCPACAKRVLVREGRFFRVSA